MIHVDFMMSGHKQRFILRLEANNQAISTLSKLYRDTVTLWLPGIRKLITYYTWHCTFLGYENSLVRTRWVRWVMIPLIISKSLYVRKRVFAFLIDLSPCSAMDKKCFVFRRYPWIILRQFVKRHLFEGHEKQLNHVVCL